MPLISSAGKFWEPNGFKRFLEEAAVKLGQMYGDPRSAFTFARMPIVIVAYSGGFGPTLSVLDRGGVRSRVRGLVLLDALYRGIDKFADWITCNRSTFFVSSYTPHTARHNTHLQRLLRERSVAYSSELRSSHLQGMVTFLPAGDISHRDFVNHAWADNPIKDILLRMDDAYQRIENGWNDAIALRRRNRIAANSSARLLSSAPISITLGSIRLSYRQPLTKTLAFRFPICGTSTLSFPDHRQEVTLTYCRGDRSV